QNVAARLNGEWSGRAAAHHIAEYYDYAGAAAHMRTRGLVTGESDNLHDDAVITLNMLIEDPSSIRYEERLRTRQAHINGVDISDREWALRMAREIVDFRAAVTSDAIRRAITATN